MMGLAEYIWIDGTKPTQKLRSKARFISTEDHSLNLDIFPIWSFDGSSTNQSTGGNSDLLLRPVSFCPDPLRGPGNHLVMCEVLDPDGLPHASNTRALLREVLDNGASAHDVWLGFEQEYTLYQGPRPLGWPENGFPHPQGPFYCGVGAENAYGRQIIERHAKACIDAGLMLYGINAEVMPGQWEFQIGYRGLPTESASPLVTTDQMWLARWLLYRIAEDFNVIVSLQNKPVSGDWNGAGCHTNFSTNGTRSPEKGPKVIADAITALSKKHDAHIAVYGHGLAQRLTGHHETCSITEFRAGVSDRGASIRIPQQVKLTGYGYLEDRRPGANCDPYLVAARLLATICHIKNVQIPFDDTPVISRILSIETI